MTPETKHAMLDGHATRNFIVTAGEGSRGMEHVAFNWTPGRPIRIAAALVAARRVRDQIYYQQTVMKNSANQLKVHETINLVPCILDEVKAFHDKAFQALGSMEARVGAVIRAIKAVCPHRAAFPLDNPADGNVRVRCEDCDRDNIEGREVYDGNARAPSAQIMYAWNQLHRNRPHDLVVPEQRRARILAAVADLPSRFPTQADADLLASLQSVLRADLEKVDKALEGRGRVRRDYETEVEAHMGVFRVLDVIGSTSIREAAAVDLASDLIGEFVTAGTGMQKHIAEFVQQIDIWN